MLVSGKYRHVTGDEWWERFLMTITVKETKSSYIFTLLEVQGDFIPTQIESLFKKSNRAVIRKQKSGHPVKVGDDNTWFVIYPYQAGIPVLFELEESDRFIPINTLVCACISLYGTFLSPIKKAAFACILLCI